MGNEIWSQRLVDSPRFGHFSGSLRVFILDHGKEDDDGNFYHKLSRFYLVFLLRALIFIIEKTRKRIFHLVFFNY